MCHWVNMWGRQGVEQVIDVLFLSLKLNIIDIQNVNTKKDSGLGKP